MDLRVVTLFTLLSAVLFLCTDGHPPKCCVALSRRIPRHILKKVQRYEEQSSTGICDIDALILYTKIKKFSRICAPLKVKAQLNQLKKKKPRLLSGKMAAP